jgi:hypothetical protein
MTITTIASFDTQAPAEQLCQRLNASGLHASVHDESSLQRFWFLAHPHAAFRLRVPEEEAATAAKYFEEWQTNEGALHEALRCPQCRSLRIDYPQMTRKFVLPTLVAHGLSLFGVLKHEFYCQDCQFTWRLPAKLGWRKLPERQAELPKGFHRRTA